MGSAHGADGRCAPLAVTGACREEDDPCYPHIFLRSVTNGLDDVMLRLTAPAQARQTQFSGGGGCNTLTCTRDITYVHPRAPLQRLGASGSGMSCVDMLRCRMAMSRDVMRGLIRDFWEYYNSAHR